MSKRSDDLFNITMTKAESAAANEVWEYIKNNSIGMQVFSTIENTKTNFSIQEVKILQNNNPHSFKKELYAVAPNKTVPLLEFDELDYIDQPVHRVYSPSGSEIWVLPFEIACNPSVRFCTIIENENFSSSKILLEAGKVLCSELDYQVHATLAAALSLGNKMISETDVNEYFKIQPSFEPFYKCLIVSRSFVNDSRIKWRKNITNDDFRVANAGYLKCKNGNSIPIHFIASEEEGIIFAGNRNGDLIINHKPYVIKNRDAKKLSVNLVVFMSVGIVAYESPGAYYKL